MTAPAPTPVKPRDSLETEAYQRLHATQMDAVRRAFEMGSKAQSVPALKQALRNVRDELDKLETIAIRLAQ